MNHKQGNVGGESLSIGWISISELFLLVGAVMIAVSAMLDGDLVLAETKNDVDDDHILRLKHVISTKDAQVGDLTKRVATALNEKDIALQRERDAKNESVELRRQKNKAIDAQRRAETQKDRARKAQSDAEQAQSDAEQARRNAEQAQINAEQEKEKAEVDALQADNAKKEAEEARELAEREQRKIENEATELKDTIERYKRAYGALKKQHEKQVADLELRLEVATAKVLKPLSNDRLVVSVSCSDLPANLDLDLYVQQPDDKVCHWKTPRMFAGAVETAVLVPSEDLKRVTQSDENTQEEERYFSNRSLTSTDKPYLVSCMLRLAQATSSKKLSEPVKVHWLVEVKDEQGAIEHSLQGNLSIEVTGAVMYERGFSYLGLKPLVAFK